MLLGSVDVVADAVVELWWVDDEWRWSRDDSLVFLDDSLLSASCLLLEFATDDVSKLLFTPELRVVVEVELSFRVVGGLIAESTDWTDALDLLPISMEGVAVLASPEPLSIFSDFEASLRFSVVRSVSDILERSVGSALSAVGPVDSVVDVQIDPAVSVIVLRVSVLVSGLPLSRSEDDVDLFGCVGSDDSIGTSDVEIGDPIPVDSRMFSLIPSGDRR